MMSPAVLPVTPMAVAVDLDVVVSRGVVAATGRVAVIVVAVIVVIVTAGQPDEQDCPYGQKCEFTKHDPLLGRGEMVYKLRGQGRRTMVWLRILFSSVNKYAVVVRPPEPRF
jgi:hypothetical protein